MTAMTRQELAAREALGVKDKPVDFREAGLGKPFANKVWRRQEIKAQKDELEQELKALNEEIGSLMMATGNKSVICDDYRVTITEGMNRSISKEKLLELGVSATLILKASKETPYNTVTITPIKDKEKKL